MEWKIKTPFQLAGYSPGVELACGDTVYDWDAHRFIAFRPDPGDNSRTKEVWNTKIDGDIHSVPGCDGRHFYIRSEDGCIVILDRISGKILQKKPLLWEPYSSRGLVVDKSVLYSSSERLLYAMRLE
jgi:hypothetical protein